MKTYKFIEKSSLLFKKGIEIDSTKNVYRFNSFFGFKSRIALIQEEVIFIEIITLNYSHYTGSSYRYGNTSSTENKNKVYTLEISSSNNTIKVYNSTSDRKQVSLCANFLSSFLKIKISRKEIDLNKYQSDNLSREMKTDSEPGSE